MGLPTEIHPLSLGGNDVNTFKVANSLRFRASNSAYLSRTPASSSNQQIMTLSSWVKISDLSNYFSLLGAQGSAQGNQRFHFYVGNNYQMGVQYTAIQTATYISVYSTDVFRDPSAWYHFVFAIDLTQASYTNAIKMWVNNRAITSFGGTTYTSGYSPPVNSSSYTHYIGRYYDSSGGAIYGGGYMAETNFVDGQQLDPTYFGQTDSITNQWIPKKYTGTYGTNGFYLPFNDATSTTTLGYDRQLGMSDSSKNNWTLSNISVTSGRDYDSMIDSPTNYNDGSTYYNRGNYCTINPLDGIGSAPPTLSEGNLRSTSIFAGNSGGYSGTIGVTTGKWYFEVEPISNGGYGETFVGILGGGNAGYWCGGPAASYSTYGIYAVAFDVDAGKFWIKLASSGNWASGDPALGTSASATFTAGSTIRPYIYNNRSTGFNNSGIGVWNFGQRPFNYTPPTGYKALNTYNLADPSLPLV